MPSPKPKDSNTLALAGDGDDEDIVLALERAFGVELGPEASRCETVGDLYEAILQQVATSDAPGKCASSMAFYRVRAALRRMADAAITITPDTQLSEVMQTSAKQLCRRLEDELGGKISGYSLTWLGGCGLVGILAGLVAPWLPGLWPSLALVPLGVVMVWLDPGTFGRSTVADVARSFAANNFALLKRDGADSRPEAIWAAARLVVAECVDLDPARITRDTRFFA